MPYEFVNYKIIIPVLINGKSYRFLFDTGAPNMISEKVLKDVDFKPLKGINVNDVNKDQVRMNMVSIKELQIGEAIFKNQTAIVADESSKFIFGCFEIDGIIGSNLLKDVIAKMNHDERKLYLSDRIENMNIPSTAKSVDLHYKDKQASPYMRIHLTGNNKKRGHEYCLFDSGMGGLFDLSLRNFKLYQNDTLFSQYNSSKGSTSMGLFAKSSEQEEYRILVPQLEICKGKLTNVITVSTVTDESRIGAKLLDYANITLDYLNQKFYFEWKSDSINLYEKEFEFTATLHKGKLAVGSVWNENLNEKIQFGDYIVQFNDLILEEINLCDLITNKSIFKRYKKAKIRFQKENGTIVELELNREDFK